MRTNADRIFAVGVSLAVVAAIVAGLAVIPTPHQARLENLDAKRVAHLQRLDDAIKRYQRAKNRLPKAFSEIEKWDPSVSMPTKDPVTNRTYEYVVVDAVRYRLCADFDTERTTDSIQSSGQAQILPHGKGEFCFDWEADRPAK